MEYAAEIFIEENGESFFRLYEGQLQGTFAFFHYDVGDLLSTAINIANNKDAYKAEQDLRVEKLSKANLISIKPGIAIPDWSEAEIEFINFASFVSVLEQMPEDQINVFKDSPSFMPSNPWERGECGFNVHFSFDRPIHATVLSFKSIFDALLYDGYEVRENNVRPTRCQNCGKLFFPHVRSDEIYCNHIFRNGKTCKELGYEMKIEADQIMKEYRRIYKMQNARKQRNSHRLQIAEYFDNWKLKAKEQLSACKRGDITIEEMINRISGEEWMTGAK